VIHWCRLWAFALAVVWASPLYAQQDPRLQWHTLETPHFTVHYYQDMDVIARRVAEVAERAWQRLHVPLDWSPTDRVEMVLSDDTDDANGLATAVPLNTVRLFVTAPDDLSVLGQYDDWLSTLVLHEYTHILHADHISGIASIVNAIVGKQWAPNQVQPRWILEGLAVYEESIRTHGGRLRSPLWDAMLRADALADNFLTLDQLTSGANRWPHGNSWYLYGGYFLQYVADRFGHEALAELSRDYGSQGFPWQLNRSIHRATGRSWEDLYEDFLAAMTARYQHQARIIRSHGITEGTPLTHLGEIVRSPRFLPDGTLLYESANGQSQSLIRMITAEAFARADGTETPPSTSVDWLASGSAFGVRDNHTLVVSDIHPHRDLHFYHDLYLWQLERDGTSLQPAESQRLTDGWRAQQPDVSPDGDHVVFTVNHRGTTSLFEMSLTERVPHALFRPNRYEQVYAPRYAPDGRYVAFSHWRTGGRRDIAVIDRNTGARRYLTDDVAMDASPTFSPDGRWIVWSSDRTGVVNLYAREVLATGFGPLRQMTNVMLAAMQPCVSPDGRFVAYVSYSHRGYDIARMPFDPTQWRDPETVDSDPLGRAEADEQGGLRYADMVTVEHPYRALDTLRPRTWMAEVSEDGFGTQLALRFQGSDILGRHGWNARLAVGLTRGDPMIDATYVYRGLRPTLRLRAYRSVDAGSGYRVGRQTPTWVAERVGGESEVSMSFPGRFDAHTVALTYDASYVHAYGGLPDFARYVDPNEAPPTFPFQGWLAGLRLTWSYSWVRRYTYSISPQEGVSLFATMRVSDEFLGSAVGSVDASFGGSVYVPMPWGVDRQRHVLAMHLGMGIGVSDRGERGIYGLGGFPALNPTSLLETLRFGSVTGGVALRGYEPNARVGSQFQLLNFEYRFPIVRLLHGPSTFPVFFQRIWGDVFADIGHAGFGRFNVDQIAAGVGAEAMMDIVVGYVVPLTVRMGWARGLMQDGTDQLYALFGAPF
jgi:hypothetical protein